MDVEDAFLDFSIIVKPEYLDLAREVSGHGAGDGSNHWVDPALEHPQWKWLQDWASYPMSNFIPHGYRHGFDCHRALLIDREWTVSCAVENESSAVDYFVENVLPILAEKVDWCRTKHVEFPSPGEWQLVVSDWQLVNGKMIKDKPPPMLTPDE